MADPLPHKVNLVAYDSEWPMRAALESARIGGAIGPNLRTIEHFGSTAVPGLIAKPVIDLMAVVANLEDLDWRRPCVEALGYEWHGEFGIAGRRFCTLTQAGVRLVHLHAYPQDSGQIGRHLAFRDYLRAHPEVARAYEAEKRRAAAVHPNDSIAYNGEKAAWLLCEEARAMVWAGITDTRLS
jgi:GrpB-like predicted nucleotidyltransferase (UPF0157 family)